MRKTILRLAGATGVTAALILAAVPASAGTAKPADTIACGTSCQSVFADELGSGTTLNAYVPGDNGTGEKAGQKVNMHLAGNFRPNGDWFVTDDGPVIDYCGFFANDFFSPTSYVCTHYPFFEVLEANFAPFGNESGLCAGVARAGVAGEGVTLQPCGATAATVWIADHDNATLGGDCLNPVATVPVSPGDPSVNYCPWINGGDTHFSQPLVLTLNTGTRSPANQMMLDPELLVGGKVRSNQLFAYFNGPVS